MRQWNTQMKDDVVCGEVNASKASAAARKLLCHLQRSRDAVPLAGYHDIEDSPVALHLSNHTKHAHLNLYLVGQLHNL